MSAKKRPRPESDAVDEDDEDDAPINPRKKKRGTYQKLNLFLEGQKYLRYHAPPPTHPVLPPLTQNNACKSHFSRDNPYF
jgi:hypothetical protein